LVAIQGHEIGPLIYTAVVHDMQQVGTVAGRIIIDEMRKLYIYDMPGEDVKVLTSTLFEYCRRLEGVQNMPFDLAGIVAAYFLKSATMDFKSATMDFNIEMQTIYKQAIANKMAWQQVLTMVGTEYQTLLGNGLWEAKSIKPETTVKALKAEIKKEFLSELCQLEVKPGGGTPASTTNERKKNPNIICFTCKEKGHISSTVPRKELLQKVVVVVEKVVSKTGIKSLIPTR